MNHVEEIIWNYFNRFRIVSTDSRNIKENSIFFALKGEKFDGNSFAKQALEKGACIAVIDNPNYYINEKTILVENSLTTLQRLAQKYRSSLTIPIIGITGSNGKTTTKELIATALSSKYNVYYTQGNLNNHIGVPLTILSIEKNTEIAVIEMGANHPGEIKFLSEIASPNYGIITNIGKAHLEGFGSFEGVKNTKKELYDYLQNNNGTAFVNSDNNLLMELSSNLKRITYGQHNGFITGKPLYENEYLNLIYTFKQKEYHLTTNLIGTYNFENVMAAICIALYFGCSPESINKKLSNYQPKNNRSQLIKTEYNTIIMDAYNANPTSMSAAIENFSKQKFENKVLILGDMLELGKYSEEEHKKILNLAVSINAEKIILVGKEFAKIYQKEIPNLTVYEDTETLIESLKKNPLKNYTILIKGSHGIHLEKILPYV